MKSKRNVSLLCFALLGAFMFAQAQQAKQKAIMEMLGQYEEALSSKSASNVADIFHDDAQILPEGKPVVKGREAIIANFKGLETIDFKENFELKEYILAEDYVIIQTKNVGHWGNPTTKESGDFEVKGMMVLKPDEEGKLKIFRYAYNGNG